MCMQWFWLERNGKCRLHSLKFGIWTSCLWQSVHVEISLNSIGIYQCILTRLSAFHQCFLNCFGNKNNLNSWFFVTLGHSLDLADYAKNQDSGSIRSSCHIMPPKCGEKPCMHGGKCTEGWNRFICDCSETSFTGPTCGRGEFISYFWFSIHM